MSRRKAKAKLTSLGRLSELRVQPDRRDGFVPKEVPTTGELSELNRLLQGQRLILERENLPGSWAWRNPANSTAGSAEKGDSAQEE